MQVPGGAFKRRVCAALLPGGWDADVMAGVGAATLEQTLSEWMAEQQGSRNLGPLGPEQLPHSPLRLCSVGFLPLAAEPTQSIQSPCWSFCWRVTDGSFMATSKGTGQGW